MNHQDFYFWLQGYFELRQETGFLSGTQLKCIQNHLNLVRKVDGRLKGFASWLDGMLTAFTIACQGDYEYPDRLSFTKSIQEKLSECFAHEVDGKYDAGKQETKVDLANVHKPSHPPFDPGSTLIRC